MNDPTYFQWRLVPPEGLNFTASALRAVSY